jgi:hypothetical protein
MYGKKVERFPPKQPRVWDPRPLDCIYPFPKGQTVLNGSPLRKEKIWGCPQVGGMQYGGCE